MSGGNDYYDDRPRARSSGKRRTGIDIGGGFMNESSCLDICYQTQVSSPKPEVVAELHVGDILDIDLYSLEDDVFVAVSYQTKIVGGLASPGILEIRECLLQGVKFQATVMSIFGGLIRIEVYAVQEG